MVDRFAPDLLALEKPFLGFGNRSSLLVCVAREVVQLSRVNGLDLVEVSPAAVKKAITGSGRATKRQVAEVLSERYMFDAVGVALAASMDRRAGQRHGP